MRTSTNERCKHNEQSATTRRERDKMKEYIGGRGRNKSSINPLPKEMRKLSSPSPRRTRPSRCARRRGRHERDTPLARWRVLRALHLTRRAASRNADLVRRTRRFDAREGAKYIARVRRLCGPPGEERRERRRGLCWWTRGAPRACVEDVGEMGEASI